METKKVTYKNLGIGQEVKGAVRGGRYHSFTGYVKETTPAFVTIEKWQQGSGDYIQIPSDSMFEVELTEEEFRSKYHEKAKEVLLAIQNRLKRDELGSHEMWNAWLDGNPYKMAAYCIKEGFRVIGHSTDIVPKHDIFSDDTMDAAVCIEYEDGDRHWCHHRSADISRMVERYGKRLF